MKLTVRSQLILAFGSLVFLILVIAGVAIKVLSDTNARFETYVNGINARSTAAHMIREAVDARAIAARNLVLVKSPEDIRSEKALVENAHAAVSANMEKLLRLAKNPDVPDEIRQKIDEINKIEQKYAPVALSIVKLALEQQTEAAIEKMNTECRPLLAALVKATSEYSSSTSSREAAMLAAAASDYHFQRNVLIFGCLLVLFCSLAAGALIIRKLFGALGAEPVVLSDAASQIADGNLTMHLELRNGDNSSVMFAMARMQEALTRVVSGVRTGADSVYQASAEIVAGNSSLSARTENQASSLEETAASMEELGSTVKQNAENAKQARQLSQNATGVATRGGEVMSQVISTMKEIDNSSQKIADIIAVIDGIAFQTNILALNAAVEAARAGEQGRGFAVVAGEVRNLAGRCADAAKEIKALITTSVEQVSHGSKLVDQAGLTMREVVESITHVADIMNEISSASSEQSDGVGQIGSAVVQMDQATQQNASFVEEMSQAATNMQMQAQELVRAVSIFRLDQQQQAIAPMQQNMTPAPVAEKPSGRVSLSRPRLPGLKVQKIV